MILPSASTDDPPPSAAAALCAVAKSCEPLIASRLFAFIAPGATFLSVTGVPNVPSVALV
ncbi:hypothetical protein BG58_08500 [Caballeronia jiangsuensis]|nr:hypothetical protein BG58_08500 [Caballeronia jiangsuensis]